MSRLTDLIAQVRQSNPALAKDLDAEFRVLSQRVPFGLNFERHLPEVVQLPGRRVRTGDTVVFRAPRGASDKGLDRRTWRVTALRGTGADRVATLTEAVTVGEAEPATAERAVEDLVVVATFRDPIYPGLRPTGRVARGGPDRPWHTVINGENYHALEALLFAYEGKVDCIYIDPPYNTRDKDWKYNNDYVDRDDAYRHSKWLAMMERRLLLAKRLLNPEKSLLIVTIDESEYLRLGLLLSTVFPQFNQQMISSVINPTGVTRGSSFARSDEYVYFLLLNDFQPPRVPRAWSETGSASTGAETAEPYWRNLRRSGSGSLRADRPGMYYPIFIDRSTGRPSVEERVDSVAVLPIRPDGKEGRWQLSPRSASSLIDQGYVRVRMHAGAPVIQYLAEGEQEKHRAGVFSGDSRDPSGGLILEGSSADTTVVTTQWAVPSHSARHHGAALLNRLIPDRLFPFPKSLYAVEDALRFFVKDKPDALVLDFFAGSGTTAHAVMRLNRQDGGRRRAVLVTNNEVSADEQKLLREQNLRPGDPDWEALGIARYITQPRIEAAITGRTPQGDPIKGEYRFTDEFPMAEGFEENAEFFDLTYEDPLLVQHGRAFAAIAPLLWLRAGAVGRRIDAIDPDTGWDVADAYGVLADLDRTAPFLAAVAADDRVRLAYIVTDDERRFQMVCADLPEGVEPIRLYEAYLTNVQANSEQAEA